MRKHASMLYHAMPWRAHVVDFLRNASERTFTMLNTTTINVSRKIITNINAFKCKSKTCVYDMNFDPKLFKSFELRLRGRSGARNGILRQVRGSNRAPPRITKTP